MSDDDASFRETLEELLVESASEAVTDATLLYLVARKLRERYPDAVVRSRPELLGFAGSIWFAYRDAAAADTEPTVGDTDGR